MSSNVCRMRQIRRKDRQKSVASVVYTVSEFWSCAVQKQVVSRITINHFLTNERPIAGNASNETGGDADENVWSQTSQSTWIQPKCQSRSWKSRKHPGRRAQAGNASEPGQRHFLLVLFCLNFISVVFFVLSLAFIGKALFPFVLGLCLFRVSVLFLVYFVFFSDLLSLFLLFDTSHLFCFRFALNSLDTFVGL